MATSTFRSISRPTTADERAVRVEDYLNDKLQTFADLENLDGLLKSVRDQQTILHKQLSDAVTSESGSASSQAAHFHEYIQRIETFTRQQTNIDRRLLIVTRSEISDGAVRKFDETMARSQRLHTATDYIALLKQVDQLGFATRENFQDSPQAALRSCLQLQNLSNALIKAQPVAEGAAPHLIDYAGKMAQSLWEVLREAFAADFKNVLMKMNWPNREISLSGVMEQEWSSGIENLLVLQELDLKVWSEQIAGSQDTVRVLLPLGLMVAPLDLRFRYHFYGDRPTNRVDKPEYFFSHIDGLLNTYEGFFTTYLQPVLSRHFRGSSLGLNTCYIDSTSAFITALLPTVREKIFDMLPRISKQPQLLSHFMHELMAFDVRLRDDWAYDAGCGADGWKGLTWEVLVGQDWFGRWLEVEKDFALSRYQAILESSERGEIDYDSGDPGSTRPTKAAIRVNDLVETVTDRYRPLTSFSQKVKFLIDIQITIFDQFRDRLNASLETYLAMTSSIARTVHGVSKEEQARLQGLGGLESLCRVYGSAEYLEKKMRDWNDDVFFLELYDEMQYRMRRKAGSGEKLAGDMSAEDIVGRTSSAIGSEDDSGALFDETADHYRRLRIRTEALLQDMLIHDIRESLRQYGRINSWSSLTSEPATSSSLAITAELAPTVEQLSSHLSFLSKVLAEAPLHRISQHVLLWVQSFLWENILMRNKFSTFGAAQFARDMSSIWETLDRYLGMGQGEMGMEKLSEAVSLLTIPVSSDQEGPRSPGQLQDVGDSPDGLNIWQVESRMFESNESAREVLEELGLEILNESEARNVLGRKIELSS